MKPGNRIPLVAAAAVVLAVVAGTVILRGRDQSAVDAPEASAAAPAASAPVAAPPDARRVAQAGGDRARTGDAVVDQMERRARMRREHEARTQALREESIRRYTTEQVDPEWAPQKERELNEVASHSTFEVAGAQPSSLDIDCRSSMCRINGEFETNGKAEDWVLMYMSSIGSRMPNSTVARHRNPDGTTVVEIYGRAR